MGGICSSEKQSVKNSKKNYELQTPAEQSKKNDEQKLIFSQKVPQKSEKSIKEHQIELFHFSKTLFQLVELFGSLDNLSNETRATLNQIIIIRSNISISKRFAIKRELKKIGIVKHIEEKDEEIIYDDQKIQDMLVEELIKLVQLIDQELRNNEEFQQVFPILSFAFFRLADNIKEKGMKNEMRTVSNSVIQQKQVSTITLSPITCL